MSNQKLTAAIGPKKRRKNVPIQLQVPPDIIKAVIKKQRADLERSPQIVILKILAREFGHNTL